MVLLLGDGEWRLSEGSLHFLVSITMLDKPIRFFNMNPWGARTSDCSIRAICAAIGMRYELVCKELGMSWKKGKGLLRDTGVDLEKIKQTFDQYFDIVQDYTEELPPEMMEEPEFAQAKLIDAALGLDEEYTGITLADFLELYRGQGTFLVGLVGNPHAENEYCRKGGHIVCARCWKGKEPYAIDSWNSATMLCDSFMRVKKTISKDDPRHWVWDNENKCFAGYGMEKEAGQTKPVDSLA